MERDTQQPIHPQAWFLPSLLEISSRAGLQITVTVSVGGLLIAGEIVDSQAFFGGLATKIEEAPQDALDPATAAQLKELFARFGAGAGPGKGEPSNAGEPDHIHLRGAKVYHPSGKPIPTAVEGAMWRVRLSAIDGFSLDLPRVGYTLEGR